MTLTTTFQFQNKASQPKNALALIYDLEGFSRFFNLPEVQDYMPEFLNHISKEFAVGLFGGSSTYFAKSTDEPNQEALNVRVAHEKFIGDGALYVLLPPEGKSDFSEGNLTALCNRLWNFKIAFPRLMRDAMDKVPIADLPKKIRFGLSRGAVYELIPTNGCNPEYIGFCINLASRLQSYCPDLGFIASARLMLKADTISENGYKKVIATKIKGFANEIVIVDSNEFEGLSESVRSDLFAELPSAS